MSEASISTQPADKTDKDQTSNRGSPVSPTHKQLQINSNTNTTSENQKKCQRKVTFCTVYIILLVTMVIVLIIVLALSLGLGLTRRNRPLQPNNASIVDDLYSPGDSRIFSFLGFYCESAQLDVNGALNASLYLIDSIPQQIKVDDFTVKYESTLEPSGYNSWHYYLYPSSVITINTCNDQDHNDSYSIHIIRGNSNADKWSKTESMEYVDQSCTNSGDCEGYSFIVTEENDYYIIVLNNQSSTRLAINMTLSISRYGYTRPDNTASESCQAQPGGSCSVGLLFNEPTQNVLVIVSTPDNVDWTERVSVIVNCNGRAIGYILISIFGVGTLFGTIIGLFTIAANRS